MTVTVVETDMVGLEAKVAVRVSVPLWVAVRVLVAWPLLFVLELDVLRLPLPVPGVTDQFMAAPFTGMPLSVSVAVKARVEPLPMLGFSGLRTSA